MRTLYVTSLAIAIFYTLTLLSGCDGFISGSGNLVKETLNIKDFNALRVSGAFSVYLSQGETESVVIEADDNIHDYIIAEVQGKTLRIGTRCIGISDATMKAYISVKNLEEIKVSGAVELKGEVPLEVSRIALSSSGASKIDMELHCERLYVDLSGAGKIKLDGQANRAAVEISGAGEMNAKKLTCETLKIQVSGAGNAGVNVMKEIDARVSGAGNIRYRGNPKVFSQISAAGSIRQIE
ncbi:MAG: head GIN domain-containing protein [Bacteroidales bacterium]|nr:head GIN domain-containing protein [Bacteroidales bacterium]